MASNSNRRSRSSAGRKGRKRVVIAPGHPRDGDAAASRKKQASEPARAHGTGASSGRGRTPASGKSVRSRKVADAKRIERERRLARQRRVFRLRLVAAALLVAGLATGAVALYNSSVFEIRSVEVVGAVRLSDDAVRSVAAVPEGSTLLRFPRTEMVDRLLAHPWIYGAQVSRDFPDGVRIRIEERKPVAQVDTGEARFWLIDVEGVVLEQRAPETTGTLVTVRDLEDFDPVVGEESDSKTLANALAVLDGLSEELRMRTRAISAQSVDVTTLITTDDVEILVGTADDIGKKDVVARRILEEQAGSAIFINVRTVDRPTWRGLEPAQ